MTGIIIGLIVVFVIGMVHYQMAIAPMADKHGHIIKEDETKGGE